MSNVISQRKLELEKELVKLKSKLVKNQLNLLALSFCFIIFYPIIIFMIYLDTNIGIQFESSLREKFESFENLEKEFNMAVSEYNSL